MMMMMMMWRISRRGLHTAVQGGVALASGGEGIEQQGRKRKVGSYFY